MNQIKQAVETFVRAGDVNDVSLLQEILHPRFQNVQEGFFEKKGIFVFTKEEYIDLVRSKKFGGSERSIDFTSIERMGDIAIVKVTLESIHLKFISIITTVFENNRWLVINNTPKIEMK